MDKTEVMVPSKSMYYNKWVPSSTGEYKLKVKAYKSGKYVKMTSAKIKVTAQKNNFRSMDVIENNQLDLISVYPNPNNGLVNLNLGNLVSAVIKVYGSHGQVVYQQNL